MTLKEVRRWFVDRKAWFNPMPTYTARLAKEGLCLPTLQELYRLFTGCLLADTNSSLPFQGRHAGLFDYFTFFLFYGAEAGLRGHAAKDAATQEKMKKYLIPLWGPLNIVRASSGMGIMVGVTSICSAVAIPLLILASIGLGAWKLGQKCYDASQPWLDKWASAREKRRIAREDKRMNVSPEQAILDEQKVKLRDLKAPNDRTAKSYLRDVSSTWLITKTITYENNEKNVTYERRPCPDPRPKQITKIVYEGKRKELLAIRKKSTERNDNTRRTFIEKPPRKGAPNRLVVKVDKPRAKSREPMQKHYLYIPRA